MLLTNFIHDRGRGPELVDTRITVYNLLPHFLDPTATEDYICRLYDLTPVQVAAARAYVLNNVDTVLDQHLKIEARIAAGNPPELIEQGKQTRARFQRFRAWLADREQAEAREAADEASQAEAGQLPTFQEWLDEQESVAEKP